MVFIRSFFLSLHTKAIPEGPKHKKSLGKIDTKEITELTAAVCQIVGLIPSGRATSYGAIARAIGHPGHARLVGRIMGHGDSVHSDLPAHRVVNSRGMLSGYGAFDPPGRMQELLESEGVAVRCRRIVNWKHVFWDPSEEL